MTQACELSADASLCGRSSGWISGSRCCCCFAKSRCRTCTDRKSRNHHSSCAYACATSRLVPASIMALKAAFAKTVAVAPRSMTRRHSSQLGPRSRRAWALPTKSCALAANVLGCHHRSSTSHPCLRSYQKASTQKPWASPAAAAQQSL